MNEKKLRISAIAMTCAMFVIALIESLFPQIYVFGTIGMVVNPILFIATVAAGYFIFKGKTTFDSKWLFVVLAIQLVTTLGSPLEIFTSGTDSTKVIMVFGGASIVFSVVTSIFATVGNALIITGLLLKKFKKLLPIGFGILAAVSPLGIISNSGVMGVVLLLIYVAFVVLTVFDIAGLKKLLRTIILILSLVVFVVAPVSAIEYIILACIISPIGKPRLNFAKAVAILLAICTILSVVSYFILDPFDTQLIDDKIEEYKTLIKENKEHLTNYKDSDNLLSLNIYRLGWSYYDAPADAEADTSEEAVEKVESKKKEVIYYNDLIKAEKDKLEIVENQISDKYDELDIANEELDEVCYRSSYSYYYCDDDCREYHNKVSSIQSQINSLESDRRSYEDKIDDYEECIETLAILENNIEYYKDLLSEHKNLKLNKSFTILFELIALLWACAGLICLAVSFFRQVYKKVAFIGCALASAGAFLFMLLGTYSSATYSFDLFSYPIVAFLARPELFSIAIMALLAVIFAKGEGKLIRYRVAIIVASVLMLFTGLSVAPLYYAVYAVTLILAALVLVPCRFTEYNNIAKHLFFSFITLGIWDLIWVFNVTKNLNKVSGAEKRRPWLTLILCLVLPLYFVYWFYKTAELVEAYGKENGKEFKFKTLCLAFTFVCPAVPFILIQDRINQIVGKPE